MRFAVLTFIATVAGASGAAWAVGLSCPPDSVPVGDVCVDKYEASVWQVDLSTVEGKGLVRLIQGGRVTLADLIRPGATELSEASHCNRGFPDNFPPNGQWSPVSGSNPPSPGIYAVSVAGVHPTACITWFQAAEACRLSGKRLLTNLEWQDAAAGTPDPGNSDDHATTCNTKSSDVANTGARTNCKSRWGVFDMVGNVDEWVADWVPSSSACGVWRNTSGDGQCLAGASTSGEPGALLRGGGYDSGTSAGVFSVGDDGPDYDYAYMNTLEHPGFRCVWR